MMTGVRMVSGPNGQSIEVMPPGAIDSGRFAYLTIYIVHYMFL